MAVHTIIIRLLIVEKGFFRKILQATLVNPHPVPHPVAWCDTAIDQIGIDFIFDYLNGKRRISKPSVIFAYIDPDRKVPPTDASNSRRHFFSGIWKEPLSEFTRIC